MADNIKLPSPKEWREQRAQEAQRILKQLPEIEDAEFTLTWEMEVGSGGVEDRYWTIKQGRREIYREPARREDYHRFELLARLLKERYGSRIRDLVPLEENDASYYLYGDLLGAVRRVESARRRNFG